MQNHPDVFDWSKAQLRRFNKETKSMTYHNRMKTLFSLQNLMQNHIEMMNNSHKQFEGVEDDILKSRAFVLEYEALFQSQVRDLLTMAPHKSKESE